MKKIFTIAAILLLSIVTTRAQFVYPNEECSGAIQLNVSNNSRLYDTLWLDNKFADVAPGSIPHCNGTNIVRRDLWYTFTATDTALYLITKFYPSQAGGVSLQLFTGGCTNLTSVACYNDLNNRVGGLSIGQQYYLRSFYGNSLSSDFPNFTVNVVAKPTNDDCTGALLLPVLDANTDHSLGEHYTAALATRTTTGCNAPAVSWGAAVNDVWYKFVATATSHSVYISGGASEAIVYRESAGTLTQIAFFDFYEPTEIEDLTNLVPGNTYYIRVGSSAVSDFTIGIFGNAPTNDNCVNADTVLMSSSFTCENDFTISNRMVATTSTGGCTSTSIAKDVWFIFQATAAAVTVRATEEYNTRMGLSEGTCGALTCLISSTDPAFTYSGLTVGNYYYLQVGGGNEEQPVTICISPAITNDECSGAITIPVKPYGEARNTVVYTGNATQSLPPCSGSGVTRDVWYRFTTTDTAHLVVMDGGSRFQVFSGGCAALIPLYCGGSVTQPLYTIDRTEKVASLVPGQSYYIRLWDNGSSQTMLTIDVTELLANDECAGAKLLIPQQALTYEPITNNGIYQASESLPPCSTATSRNDIWYKFIAPASSATIISNMVNTLSSISTIGLELFSGSCGSLTSIGCVQQGTALAHKAQNFSNLVAGNTYYIRQYGNVINNTITVITPPANDDITGAIQLYPSPSAVQNMPSYSSHASSKRFGRMCTSNSATMDHDTWFYFVAEAASHTVTTTNGNSFWDEESTAISRLEAFRGFAADSLSLAAKLITCANTSLALNGLAIGDTVYIRVGSFGAGLTNIFTIKVSNALSMDEPAGAALLSKRNVYEYKVNTSGATQSIPASCSITDFPDDDIWFKFNAASDVKRIVAGNETQNITLQLFSGTPGNLTPVLCSSNIMVLPSILTNGNLYYLRTYTKANTTRGEFTIGLFGEEDLYANSCNQSAATLGPNLVINPRFEIEEPYVLPIIYSGYGYPGKKMATGWWGASVATPDTWSANHPLGGIGNVAASSGYAHNKIPRSGQSMLGMLNTGGWHEYVTGKLSRPLTKGKTYFVSFYMSFAEDNANEAFKIGALLNNDSIHNNIGTGELDITPQVGIVPGSRIDAKTKWYNVCGYMTADKAYSFITLGNFGNSTIYAGLDYSTYMFVDDVVVAEVINQVVPLSLLDFRGRMNAQQQNELSWVTAGETNTKHFEVEWRTDTKPFVKVGTVEATGNSSIDKYYKFLHATPATGYNYYRLKMYDNDGKFTYSPVVRTGNISNNNNLSVHPNPVSATLNVTASVEKNEMVLFKIVDSYGRTVAAKQRVLQKGSNTFSWDITTLAPGNYFMVSAGNGHTTVKLIKR